MPDPVARANAGGPDRRTAPGSGGRSGASPPELFRAARIDHWDRLARAGRSRRWADGYYHRRLAETCGHLVAPGLRVLEIGCGEGDLLAAVRPSRGVGVDFSTRALERARARHPRLCFIEQDAHELAVKEEFDVIVLSDLVNDLWDVQVVLERVRLHCTPSTRVVLNTYSRVWEAPLGLARRLGLARPLLQQNWLAVEDLENLLRLAGLEPFRRVQDVLWPLGTPFLAGLANRWLVKCWPFKYLALTSFVVARPEPRPAPPAPPPAVTVVVPARNEAGNVDAILDRVPQMGSGTEIVFVEGHSSDDTWASIEAGIAARPARGTRARLLRQQGRGKGDAVRLGFAEARGEVLMILDADLTVPPEDLPRFYDALVSRRGDFVNGVRLVYPMEDRAMRFLNLVANRFFGLAFSWTLGQTVKDTLCGTKVLWKRDYERIAANRATFGELDPFGDFDLLFGAAKQNLRIVDLPIRYRERTYGATNIHRFRHGALLFRMLLRAARRIKFV